MAWDSFENWRSEIRKTDILVNVSLCWSFFYAGVFGFEWCLGCSNMKLLVFGRSIRYKWFWKFDVMANLENRKVRCWTEISCSLVLVAQLSVRIPKKQKFCALLLKSWMKDVKDLIYNFNSILPLCIKTVTITLLAILNGCCRSFALTKLQFSRSNIIFLVALGFIIGVNLMARQSDVGECVVRRAKLYVTLVCIDLNCRSE